MKNRRDKLKVSKVDMRWLEMKPLVDMTQSLYPEAKELVRALARRDAQAAYREQLKESGD